MSDQNNETVEETTQFQPKFDAAGLVTCVTVDHDSRDILMVAHMNETALKQTLATGNATYWSRSRQSLWVKGETSGAIQKVVEMRIDCDQDAVVLFVNVPHRAQTCHTGRNDCFYRIVTAQDGAITLSFADD